VEMILSRCYAIQIIKLRQNAKTTAWDKSQNYWNICNSSNTVISETDGLRG